MEMVEMNGGIRKSPSSFCESIHTVRCRVTCDIQLPSSPLTCLRTSPRLVHNGTFMVTAQSGSTASLTFNGTAVWLYGSKGKNNGKYNVTLDDDSVFVGNGFSDEDLFQQVLFKATGLDGSKTHRLTVGNVGANETKHLVIDSVSSASPVVPHCGIGH